MKEELPLTDDRELWCWACGNWCASDSEGRLFIDNLCTDCGCSEDQHYLQPRTSSTDSP